MTLRSLNDFEVICPHPSCYKPSYIVLGFMAAELHAMRIVCLLKAVIPAWVTNTVQFLLVIDYNCHSGSFEILQAKVKCLLSGPACFKQTLLRAPWAG